jgi:DNA-binding NarL/FixJ family response regulator
MSRRGVLIADDHALMAEGLARILSAEYDVLGVCHDGRQLVMDATRLHPDIICLDIGMPSLNGIQAAVELTRLIPKTKLIFVTQQIELPYLRAAFRAGALGYVAKQSAGSELLAAMKMVIGGNTYITPLLAENGLVDPNDLRSSPTDVFTEALTPRQREVLQLVAEGRTIKEIASTLNISSKTVEFHKGCLMDELGLRTTAELTRYALGTC